MSEPNESLLQLLQERRIASVATISDDGLPHLTSVWFLYENGSLYLAIPSASAKGRNLSRNRRIAVMIDVRQSGREAGLTAMGDAELLTGDAATPIATRLHEKYLTQEALADPKVGPVFAAIDDLVVKVNPEKWISWDMSEMDRQFFEGAIAQKGYLKELSP